MGDLRHDLTTDAINISQDLSQENARLRSFENWPENAPVGKQKLAKAGFFYTGKDYAVKCFSCNCEVNNWDFGDQAIQKHSATNPNCDFIQHISRSNGFPYNGANNPTTGTPSETPQSISLSNATTSHSQTNSSVICNGNAVVLNSVQPVSSTSPQPQPTVNSRNRDNKIWHTFESLRQEGERLKTFKGWPLPFVTPEELSKAGFFYLKDRDKVQCVYCRGIVGEWELGDVPMTEHCRHFPTCPFVKGQNVGNIPVQNGRDIGPSSFTPHHEQQQQQPSDITGLTNFQMFSRPEKGYVTNTELEEMGILTRYHGPKHPNYVTKESRLRSFAPWPKSFHQKPEDLADAGLYYAGISDHVKCFYCDGGLRNWEKDDIPWIEHARWFSKCEFVILTKGREFIRMATQQHPPVLPNTQVVNVPQPRYNEVTPVLITSIMQTPIVKGVMDMGISEHLVRTALVKQLQQTGYSFTSSGDLLDLCLKLQEEMEVESSPIETISQPFPVASTSTSPPPLMPRSNSVGAEVTSPLAMVRSPSIPNGVLDLESKTKDLTLEEENQRLKEMRLCKVCMDEEIGVVFLPCGHLITCPKCAPSLQDCPMCRQQIRGTVRTFLS